MDVELEWDERKRQDTLRERGLDFADVVHLNWHSATTLEDVRRPYVETRFITYGQIGGRLHVVAWCYREDRVRVFSMRKANQREVRYYGRS
jgi:uncharacterized protein